MRYPAYRIAGDIDIGYLLHDSGPQLIDQIVLAFADRAAGLQPAVQSDRCRIDGGHVWDTGPAASLVVVGQVGRAPAGVLLDHQNADGGWAAKGPGPARQQGPSGSVAEIDTTQRSSGIQHQRHVDMSADLSGLDIRLQRADLMVGHLDTGSSGSGSSHRIGPPTQVDMAFMIDLHRVMRPRRPQPRAPRSDRLPL